MPFDPVRYCVLTTVALIAWLIGAPATVMLMSALGMWAYARAIRCGLAQTKCVLKRPALAITYLAVLFVTGGYFLARQLIET